MMVRKGITNKYRFFYHYHRHGEKKMSVHFRGKCTLVDDVVCNLPCESKWNKTQPKLVMRGFCKGVEVLTDKRTKKVTAVII